MKEEKIRSHIKFLVMDADGTLTDGKLYYGENGELVKAFHVKDGYAIKEILPKHQITPIVITARDSKMLSQRCKELGILEYHQNCSNKMQKLLKILKCSDNGSGMDNLSKVAYIGDDIPDLDCMIAVKAQGGLVACPADAAEEIRKIADYVCSRKGGDGAVREFIEWIFRSGKIPVFK